MTEEKKPIKVVFAPGALDDFDGSQEELDSMIAEITALAESGELEELSEPFDMDDFSDNPEILEAISALIQSQNNTLH